MYDYIHDKESLADDIKNATRDYFQLDFCPLIFNYLTIENYIEKHNYIVSHVLPIFNKCDDLFLKRFFIKEVVKISEKTTKYKLLYELFRSYYKGECF